MLHVVAQSQVRPHHPHQVQRQPHPQLHHLQIVLLPPLSYTDPKLYFQTYGLKDENENPNDNENEHEHENDLDSIDVSNYRESLFEVQPTSSFEINDEMNSIKDPTKRAESLPRAKTEQEQFKALIEEKRGKPIFFGDKVVFKHLDSKHFIYGSFDCAQSGIGAFKIDLREELSEKLVFQLLSYRTYEKDGDDISIDAPLKIYHFETQCYLSYCMEPIFLDINNQIAPSISPTEFVDYSNERRPKYITPQLRLFYQKKEENVGLNNISERMEESQSMDTLSKESIQDTQSRYEIINENIAKRIWKFEPYLEFEEKPNKQIIRNHDIVYLLHTKDDKYLCPNNFGEEIYLNKRIDATDPDIIFDGLWEI